jgi:uncharacterized protein YbjT (DUF2867 family)
MSGPRTVLLFGATGSAGAAVLDACLADPDVAEVRALVRRPVTRTDPKLRVVLHGDFADYAPVRDVFTGVDACLFCLGISVRAVRGEAEYRRITRDFAVAAADALLDASPDASFEYLSGQGSKAASRMMWARVKAEAELDLRERIAANAWRPGFIDAARDQAPVWLRVARPLLGALAASRTLYVRGEDIGHAMLLASARGLRRQTFENRDIRALADESRRPGGAS